MNIKWIDTSNGKGIMYGGNQIASVWLATTGRHYMFWAATDRQSISREFWYDTTEDGAKKKAEKILSEKYFI